MWGSDAFKNAPTEVHGHLPRLRHVPAAATGPQVDGPQCEAFADRRDDRVEGHLRSKRPDARPNDLACIVDRDRLPAERGVRTQAGEHTLELADIRDDVLGQEQRNRRRKRDRLELGLALEDRDPGLDVGRLDVGDEPPLEAVPQPLLQLGDVLRHLVGRQDDLLALLVEDVERVEKLLLRPLAAGEELHVVQNEDVDLPEPVLERLHPIAPQRRDELVHERVGRQVRHPPGWILVEERMGDRAHQVRLSEPDAAVDEQRIVVVTRLGGDRASRRLGELVRGPDHERLEGVARAERRPHGDGPPFGPLWYEPRKELALLAGRQFQDDLPRAHDGRHRFVQLAQVVIVHAHEYQAVWRLDHHLRGRDGAQP